MPRRERPPKTERSEHWLRVAVNDDTEVFNEQVKLKFGWNPSECVEWCSPMRSDGYPTSTPSAIVVLKSLANFQQRSLVKSTSSLLGGQLIPFGVR